VCNWTVASAFFSSITENEEGITREWKGKAEVATEPVAPISSVYQRALWSSAQPLAPETRMVSPAMRMVPENLPIIW